MVLGKVIFGICWQYLTWAYEFDEAGYQFSQAENVSVDEWGGNFRRWACQGSKRKEGQCSIAG